MDHRWKRSTTGMCCLAGILALLAACTPTVAPPYQGGLALEPAAMTRFIDHDLGIKMALPQGWELRPLPTGAPQGLRLMFAHQPGDALLRIFCYDHAFERNELALLAEQHVKTADPDADELWKRQSMGREELDPEFESWVATVDEGPPPVLTHFYLGWKMAEGFGCKYVLVLTVPAEQSLAVEGDFLAMVRSLH
jgi:hypothetical protein